MKRSFASLELFEALHVAIFIEERNARIYENFAEIFARFNDDEGQSITVTFREMAEQERSHSSQLQELYWKRFRNQPCALTDADIADVIEIPQLQDEEELTSRRLTPRQALEVGLAAERQAHHFYSELAALTMEAPLRGLYWELASLERDHEELLERKLANMKNA